MSTESDEVFERCVDRLYGVLADPSTLGAAVAQAAALFQASTANYIQTDEFGDVAALASHGHDESTLLAFVGHYQAFDPAKRPIIASRVGEWFANDDEFDPDRTSQREYVNDFALRAGMRWFRGGKVYEGRTGSAIFSVQRPQDAPPFDSSTQTLYERLRPHFGRVARLSSELRGTVPGLLGSAELFESLTAGALVVDQRQKVLRANRSALALLCDSGALRIRNDHLYASPADLDAVLSRIIRDATGPLRQARVLTLNPEEALTRRIQLRVVPVHRAPSHFNGVRDDVALLLVTKGFSAPATVDLRQLFGLSSAEAELVALLASGFSPAAAADKRGVALATVRAQLKSIYFKMGANSMAQLLTMASAQSAFRFDGDKRS
ncbi:hypothetical protein ASC76_10165 [Rhizobacter sp. Root404]|nr:hypothetical protein ASC76_10165 [Rhizobacter sp. Root404]